MKTQTIVIIVLVLIILYYLYSWLTSKEVVIASRLVAGNSGEHGGDFRSDQIVPASKVGRQNGSNNFAYSIWLYIDNWNYRIGEEKVIFERGGPSTGYTPKVSLGEYENNLKVSVNVNSAGGTKVHDCVVSNIPLQKYIIH